MRLAVISLFGFLSLLDARASGIPSKVEREALRARLARIALQESVQMTRHWAPSQRDCAGFVRYVFRGSLGAGARLWADRTGQMTDYVRADELVAYNFDAVAREPDPRKVLTGDLLVYFDPTKPPDDAWHLILLLAPPLGGQDRILAIYHNGAKGKEGAVKKVWLDTLSSPAWSEWRPIARNQRFLGVYRWKGWGEGRPLPKAMRVVL